MMCQSGLRGKDPAAQPRRVGRRVGPFGAVRHLWRRRCTENGRCGHRQDPQEPQGVVGRSARCSSGWGGVLSSKRWRRGEGWGVCGFSEHTRLASCSESCPCCTLEKRDRRSENRSMSLISASMSMAVCCCRSLLKGRFYSTGQPRTLNVPSPIHAMFTPTLFLLFQSCDPSTSHL